MIRVIVNVPVKVVVRTAAVVEILESCRNSIITITITSSIRCTKQTTKSHTKSDPQFTCLNKETNTTANKQKPTNKKKTKKLIIKNNEKK